MRAILKIQQALKNLEEEIGRRSKPWDQAPYEKNLFGALLVEVAALGSQLMVREVDVVARLGRQISRLDDEMDEHDDTRSKYGMSDRVATQYLNKHGMSVSITSTMDDLLRGCFHDFLTTAAKQIHRILPSDLAVHVETVRNNHPSLHVFDLSTEDARFGFRFKEISPNGVKAVIFGRRKLREETLSLQTTPQDVVDLFETQLRIDP